eukprot:COSAG05_NODE_907_length_6645_cov_18.681638_6_plen_49_part_00
MRRDNGWGASRLRQFCFVYSCMRLCVRERERECACAMRVRLYVWCEDR